MSAVKNWLLSAVNSSGDHPRNRQQDAGDDAAFDRAQGDGGIDPPAGRSQREGRLAQAPGDQVQHVLRGAHHHRHGDQAQRDRAGPTGEVAHGRHRHGIDEQADDDGRCRQHDVHDEARRGGKFRGRAVLREVDAGQNADRRRNQRRDTDHQEAADDRVGQPATGRAGRGCRIEEEVVAERRQAVVQQRPQYPGQSEQPGRHGDAGQDHADPVGEDPAAVDRGFHQLFLSVRLSACSCWSATWRLPAPRT
jgi:hypothetical protein